MELICCSLASIIPVFLILPDLCQHFPPDSPEAIKIFSSSLVQEMAQMQIQMCLLSFTLVIRPHPLLVLFFHPTLFFVLHFWICCIINLRVIFFSVLSFLSSLLYFCHCFILQATFCVIFKPLYRNFTLVEMCLISKTLFLFFNFSQISEFFCCYVVLYSPNYLCFYCDLFCFSWFSSFIPLVCIYFGCFTNLRMQAWFVFSNQLLSFLCLVCMC